MVDSAGLIYVEGWPGDIGGGLYARFLLDGTTRDTMFFGPESMPKTWKFSGGTRTERVTMITSVPLSPRTERIVNPAGGLIFGWSEHYEVVVSPHGHDTAMVFGKNWTASPLPGWRRDAALEAAIGQIAGEWGEESARANATMSDLPRVPPAFTALSVDGRGNRWITVDPGADSTRTWFDVFDSGGVYLGQVVGPVGLDTWEMAWLGDEMVAAIEDEDGLPVVVKFRIERRP